MDTTLQARPPPTALTQFLEIHDKIANVTVQPGIDDEVRWKWTANGQYSAVSAYEMQFEGSTRFNYWDIVWSSQAPLKCRIFSWLALLGKCHTADCLQKKGWPHNAACVFCLAEPETALHLLATCPVAIRIWRRMLHTAQLPACLAPTQDTASLTTWLTDTRASIEQSLQKNWTTLAHLVWWSIWKERNNRIFNNTAASLSRVHETIVEEARLWSQAGKIGRAHV